MKNTLPSNLIFFCDDHWHHLLPLTYTKPVCELRAGILTIREKWEMILQGTGSFITQDYLSEKYPIEIEKDNLLINSTVLPDEALLSYIRQLGTNEAIVMGDEMLIARLSEDQFDALNSTKAFSHLKSIDLTNQSDFKVRRISRPYDLFTYNGQNIEFDFKLLTEGRESSPLSSTNTIIGDYPVFAESGVVAECVIFNTQAGPIYMGKDSLIMEGAMIRGPFALGEGAVVKMGAKIYGPTTVGPFSKAGGEINNSIIMANSNKSHDGYLGNSVIGEWCNLGADTNTSNLKNNYLPVKIWSYVKEKFEDTGLQFCGLIMGDHSKTAINTMLNTGTVVGVASNIFGDGFPRTFIPSFSWGGASGFMTHQINKALDTAEIVMRRRNISLSNEDRNILTHIFNQSAIYRVWEKKN
ncbi:MAG: GlmU family protein [Saprospiraceae bacterium]|nr:GlmU family protein [Saprospiraceae bacterium]